MLCLILRFSDSEVPSIPAHKKVIEAQRSTWWGWWKKREEPCPFALLQDLQSATGRGSVEIGLVNRKGTEQYCVATCADVRFSQDGSPIASPEPALTPTYYNAGKFPAWFNFTRIEEVNKQRWEDIFKVIPSLDPTFYEVVADGRGGYKTMPEPMWRMASRETPRDGILHISDVHFGEDHGFPVDRTTPGAGVDRSPLWEILSSSLLQGLRASIGIVVITGDLITRGKADGYTEADHFLRKLLEMLQLEPDHCVIVPGNHDLYTADLVNPTRQYAHEGAYRMFLRAFFNTNFQDLERVRRFRTPAGRDLIFIELNSARMRSDFLREYGFVAKHRYAGLLKFIRETLDQDDQVAKPPVFFAVLHHHVLPVSPLEVPEDKHPVSLCLDAGELIEEFQEFGINFVLHGHQHVPFIGGTSRVRFEPKNGGGLANAPLYVLGSGSSGAKRDRLCRDFECNTYSVYKPVEEGMEIVIEKYTDLKRPETLWKGVLPIPAVRDSAGAGGNARSGGKIPGPVPGSGSTA